MELGELSLPTVEDYQPRDTRLPELPRHLVSQEGKKEKDRELHDSSPELIKNEKLERRRRRVNNSKVRFADMVDDDHFVSASVDSRVNRMDGPR